MEIICYLSNGYPTIEASYNMAVEYADAGCRMMEVDFPSRNPYLESDYIAGKIYGFNCCHSEETSRCEDSGSGI